MMTLTINTIVMMSIVSILLIILIWNRLKLSSFFSVGISDREDKIWAVCQTSGSKEIQADYVQVYENSAGVMGVLADGIGKENTGKLCAQIAVDAILDTYEPYQILDNPEYFFHSSFFEANSRIQKTIGDRRGGVCLGVIHIYGEVFYYGLAGNIRIALLRNGELIPISKGQTMDVLAMEAYQEGRLSKQETIWSLEETRVWNYVGKESFHKIELCEQPIRLKQGDIIIMASCGIFNQLSWVEMEDILLESMTLQEKADCLVIKADKKPGEEKENGSVLLLKAEVTNEKNQF